MRRIFHSRFWHFPLLFLLLIGYFSPWGCKNPFKTRNSPPPKKNEGTWETPASPEIVIQNLLSAYNEKIIGNFILCLSDSFRFSAPEDSIDAVNQGRADLFANWDGSVEIEVTRSIFSTFRQNTDSLNYVLSFRLTPPVPDDIGDTVATLSRDYELFISDLRAAPPETTFARGTATFYMRQTSLNWWSIYFWVDVPAIPGEEDWADFKARYRR